MNNMHTEPRQSYLLQLLQKGKFSSQDELQIALQKKGFTTTQATLSRDLVHLGVQKENGTYKIIKMQSLWNESSQVTSVHFAKGSQLFIIKTTPGFAQCVAYVIDKANIKHVVGSIAGDDTIFVAIDAIKARSQIQKDLQKLFTQGNKTNH